MLKRCLKVRDQLLQQKFTEHKVPMGPGQGDAQELWGAGAGVERTVPRTAQLTHVPWQEAFCVDTVRDLMDALLQVRLSAKNNSPLAPELELTDDHLLMTVGDIFGAGVETTTTVLKWAVLYLLHYPEVGSASCSGGPGLPLAAGTSAVPMRGSGEGRCQEDVRLHE